MLDVHAPHATVHTWKDFFVHLATIVVGLLIAVGLEQLVEQLHDHHRLRAIQEDLRRERATNAQDLVTKQNGLVRLMSPEEANSDLTFYQWSATLTDESNVTWNAINDARRFALQDPDPTHLSRQQLAATIELTEAAIEKHLQAGYSIAFINSAFSGLPPTLSYDDIRSLLPSSYQSDPQGMAAAHQRTMERLKAAGYMPQDDELTFSNGGKP